MADNELTRRSRELLKSSEELLEQTRNRPHIEVRSWQPESNGVAAPVVHKRIEDAQVSRSMDPQSSKAWTDWAEGIARKHACLIGKEVLELSDRGFKVLADRIDELEAEVARLKGMAPEREEWPLRVVDGGKR